jgi:endonuclease-3
MVKVNTQLQQDPNRVRPRKRPFDIHEVIRRIREAVQPFPKAALFELADRGFNTVFEQLLACIISIRTLDEVTIPTAQNLFAAARTPEQASRLSLPEIDRLIHACSFHEAKARSIRQIALEAIEKPGGALPCDEATLLALPGVGPKCANLVLGIACGQSRIAVDIHVHRVTNRWGYIHAASPEQTLAVLVSTLPKKYWVEINRLLVPFGKHICTGTRPRCSTCPVLEMCRQVGVKAHR